LTNLKLKLKTKPQQVLSKSNRPQFEIAGGFFNSLNEFLLGCCLIIPIPNKRPFPNQHFPKKTILRQDF